MARQEQADIIDASVMTDWEGRDEVFGIADWCDDVELDEAGATTRDHIISMMPADDASELLRGECLYCDDGFVHALLGPLVESLEPIDEPAFARGDCYELHQPSMSTIRSVGVSV